MKWRCRRCGDLFPTHWKSRPEIHDCPGQPFLFFPPMSAGTEAMVRFQFEFNRAVYKIRERYGL